MWARTQCPGPGIPRISRLGGPPPPTPGPPPDISGDARSLCDERRTRDDDDDDDGVGRRCVRGQECEMGKRGESAERFRSTVGDGEANPRGLARQGVRSRNIKYFDR